MTVHRSRRRHRLPRRRRRPRSTATQLAGGGCPRYAGHRPGARHRPARQRRRPSSSTPTSAGTDTASTGADTTGRHGDQPACQPSSRRPARVRDRPHHPELPCRVRARIGRALPEPDASTPGRAAGGYRTLGGSELPDYLAMVSGQAPNADTEARLRDLRRVRHVRQTARRAARCRDAGCVYPNTVLTIADQVTAGGQAVEGISGGHGRLDLHASRLERGRRRAACRAPAPQYVTWHNPFVYFHSLLDLGGCSSRRRRARSTWRGICAAAKRTPDLRVHRTRSMRRARRRRHVRGRRPVAWPARTRSSSDGCRRSRPRPRTSRTGC